MAHFAQVDSNNIVIRVLVVPDSEQHRGQEFLAKDLGLGGTWIQTSYNSKIRAHFAGIGYRYDQIRDAFIPPQPFLSWIFNEELLDWEPPIPYPTNGNLYSWDETNKQWRIDE